MKDVYDLCNSENIVGCYVTNHYMKFYKLIDTTIPGVICNSDVDNSQLDTILYAQIWNISHPSLALFLM